MIAIFQEKKYVYVELSYFWQLGSQKAIISLKLVCCTLKIHGNDKSCYF